MEKQYSARHLLTTVAELQKKLGSPNLCIIDIRPAEDYARGHIPGATSFRSLRLEPGRHQRRAAQSFHVHDPPCTRAARRQRDQRSRLLRRQLRHARGARRLVLGILRPSQRQNARRRHAGLASRRRAGDHRSEPRPKPRRSKPPNGAKFWRPRTTCCARSTRKTRPSSTPAAKANTSAPWFARRAAARFPHSIHIEWTDNLDAERQVQIERGAESDVRQSRHHTGQRSRIPTARAAIAPPTATLRCDCSAFRKCATTSARGRNGATAPICRWKSHRKVKIHHEGTAVRTRRLKPALNRRPRAFVPLCETSRKR